MALNVYLLQSSSACDIKDATVEVAKIAGAKAKSAVSIILKIAVVIVPIGLLIAGGVTMYENKQIEYKAQQMDEVLNDCVEKANKLKEDADKSLKLAKYKEAINLYSQYDNIKCKLLSVEYKQVDSTIILKKSFAHYKLGEHRQCIELLNNNYGSDKNWSSYEYLKHEYKLTSAEAYILRGLCSKAINKNDGKYDFQEACNMGKCEPSKIIDYIFNKEL